MNPTDFLNKQQRETYNEYRKEREEHMRNGTLLWNRVAENYDSINPVEPEWCAIWECPYEDNGNAPMKVTTPSGNCLGELMKGGIHPPIEAHWNVQHLILAKDGQHTVVSQIEVSKVEAIFRLDHGGIENEWIVDYRRPHNEIAKPMSFQEAHEYVFAKDVPQYAWGVRRNKPKFLIIPRDKLPPTRKFRNTWRIADYTKLKDIAA